MDILYQHEIQKSRKRYKNAGWTVAIEDARRKYIEGRSDVARICRIIREIEKKITNGDLGHGSQNDATRNLRQCRIVGPGIPCRTLIYT
jgi:hypothetical protein